MSNHEFPCLIYMNSIEKTEVQKHFPILDESETKKPRLLDYFLKFDPMVDCVPYKEIVLVKR
jgi:hypothetical protein